MFREGNIKGNIFDGSRLSGISAISAGLVLTYIPWMIYAHSSSAFLGQAMGSKFVSNGIGDFATLKSLIVWTGFYISYVVLMLAPYLLVFSLYLFLVFSGRVKQTRQEAFFTATVALLSGIFLATAIQHSWRASYNYPDPNRIMGRYLIQLSPLYLILFMISLNKLKNSPASVKLVAYSFQLSFFFNRNSIIANYTFQVAVVEVKV